MRDRQRNESTASPGTAGPPRRRPGAGVLWPAGLALALAAAVIAASGMGYIRIPFGSVARIVFAHLSGADLGVAAMDPLLPTVVMDVRLPRILCAALVGGGLALAGVVYQGILLNPLADPYTLGVSAGAAFGAAVALLCDLTVLGIYTVPLLAFAGAVAALTVVIYLAASVGGLSSNNLILAGIIVAAILAAAISFMKYLADEQVAVIIFWLMGSFASRTWTDAGLVALFVALGFVIVLVYARELNLLSLGTRAAASLGVDTRRTPLLLLVTASLVAAVCVAVSGIIGFVGLIVPHMMRSVVGTDNRRLLPAALLTGAILLLAADTVTRALLPHEIPIGVLTALIGGPCFCVIFRRRQLAIGGGVR